MEYEASFLQLFQILSAHEVTDNYGNNALIALMVHHWAEMGTKTFVCWRMVIVYFIYLLLFFGTSLF